MPVFMYVYPRHITLPHWLQPVYGKELAAVEALCCASILAGWPWPTVPSHNLTCHSIAACLRESHAHSTTACMYLPACAACMYVQERIFSCGGDGVPGETYNARSLSFGRGETYVERSFMMSYQETRADSSYPLYLRSTCSDPDIFSTAIDQVFDDNFQVSACNVSQLVCHTQACVGPPKVWPYTRPLATSCQGGYAPRGGFAQTGNA